MDIVIHSLGMPFDGNTIKEKSLGGSETAAYYQAIELAKLGHHVQVFSNCNEMMEADGVKYVPCGNVTQQAPLGDAFEMYATHTPIDVLIIQRHPMAFHKPFNSRINVWQLHDLALHRSSGMVQGMLHNVTLVTVVSEWHKEQVCSVYNLNKERVHVVRNGVDPSLYENAEPFTHENLHARHFNMLYQSRPERGLEHLVRPDGIMSQLKDTNAHLFVCAYDNTTEQMRQYYAQLYQWASVLPNVTVLGALTKSKLAGLQQECDLLCYPSEFEEVSCITVMEAMHAGLPALCSVVGALPETAGIHVQDSAYTVTSGTSLIDLKDGKANEENFILAIKDRIESPDNYSQLPDMQLAAAKNYTWKNVGLRLAQVLQAAANEGVTRAALVRNAIEHSDIDAADNVLSRPGIGDAIVEVARTEVTDLFAFRKSAEAYKDHYTKHQGIYYDAHEEKVIGEDVTQSTRFQGVLQIIGSYVSRNAGYKYNVLDYGCAHGHYLIPLAKLFPHCHFTGIDISERAIVAAKKWVAREGLTNVTLVCGSQSLLAEWVNTERRESFDAILAGEVVEHVPDDVALLNSLSALSKDNGLLCISTPSGRWEWTGTTAFRTGREHLHHYTRADIEAMCASHRKTDILYAPAGPDIAGGALGSWVWGVLVKAGEKFNRKVVKHLIPRQTLSACLIVKDGAQTIRKCVESFIDAVDEVIINIDETTKDRTPTIIQELVNDYPRKAFKVFTGKSATEIGFDEARNQAVELACGDWVMWIDADEEVQNSWNMWQYLRPSMVNAIGLPQVHYSMDPPRVLTTDYPCRLFRNTMSVKFFGVVHEHPELAPGEGIPFSTLRGNVSFLHNGYVNEAVRRKRFARNLPLLLKDREKYPARKLNKFLMLRDIAQGIQFELEQTQGMLLEDHHKRAMKGVEIWREMLAVDPVKMVIDALQYYSVCVIITREGFEAGFKFSCKHDAAPDMGVDMELKGRFFDSNDLSNLITKLQKEATGKYAEKYL